MKSAGFATTGADLTSILGISFAWARTPSVSMPSSKDDSSRSADGVKVRKSLCPARARCCRCTGAECRGTLAMLWRAANTLLLSWQILPRGPSSRPHAAGLNRIELLALKLPAKATSKCLQRKCHPNQEGGSSMPAFENLAPLSRLIIMQVFKDVHGPSLFCSVSSSNLLQHCLEKFMVYLIFVTSSNYSRPKDLNTIHLVDNFTCFFHNVDPFRQRPIHLDLRSGTHRC